MMPALFAARWARPGAAVLAGIAASTALPPTGMLFALLALSAPLYWLSRTERRLEAAALGLATGFGWFLVSLSWTSQAFVTSGGWHVLLIPFPALGLPLALGAFWGAAFLLSAALCRHPVPRLLLAVALLALAEYVRGLAFTGFPWNIPGMAFVSGGFGFLSSAVVGPWGVTVATLLLAAVPALLLCGARRLSLAVFAVLMLEFGSGQIAHVVDGPDEYFHLARVRLVQPNIPQDEKWLEEERGGHLGRLVELSRQPPLPGTDLVVWPESAFAGFLEYELGTLSGTAQAASSGSARVLAGSLRIEAPEASGGKERYYNSMALFGPDGTLEGHYDKRHLVPFGEYAPFRRYIPFVDAIAGPNDFSPGRKVKALVVNTPDGRSVRMLPLICYEIVFPDAVRRALIETRADMIVNITNDAWFGNTTGPRQHLAMAQMRAAELGVPEVRVANNGISAVINSAGQIKHRIALNTSGTVDAEIKTTNPYRTRYHDHGNAVFWAMLATLAAVAGATEVLTRKRHRH